ncbi:MAG: hypothetical protein R3C45_16900 [Phycisphaerales bacterium]
MRQETGESWRFEVTCANADSVYLVNQVYDIGRNCLPMVALGNDNWGLELKLIPGHYQISYYTVEGTTLFNGGTTGLKSTRLSRPDPRVTVKLMEQPIPA